MQRRRHAELPLMTAIRRRFRTSETWFILLAVAIGVAAGLFASLLSGAAHWLQQSLFGFSGSTHLSAMPRIPAWRLLALPAGGAVLGLFGLWIRRGRRTPVDVVEANALHGGRIPFGDSAAVSTETLLSNGSGASVGLEAAYAQIGGGFASVVGEWLHLRRNDLRILVGAGAGAAIGAAFGAPLTGAFYAFEIVIGAYTPAAIAPVAAAALAAVVTARTLGAIPYLIAASSSEDIHTVHYFIYAGFGLLCGLAGIAVMRLVTVLESLVRASRLPDHLRPVVGGALLMPIAFVSPQALSAGHGALHLDLAGEATIGLLLSIFALKILASAVSLGFGFRGGLFFASLFLGTLLGRAFALILAQVPWIPPVPETDAALVGMAALAVAVVGGPMTMSLLVLEATHDFALAATVLTATLCSSAVVRERFGYSFSTWRLHLRGETLRSARDIGWVEALTAGRMMREKPPTIASTRTIADFRSAFPLGSTSRVVVIDVPARYVGIVPTTEAWRDTLDPGAVIGSAAILRDATLTPEMNIAAVMRAFDEHEADELAVVGPDRRLLGIVTERHVRRRYAEELEKTQRELFGEA
ncbi:MAG TPA: chloride channel protein [Allosphingosinicella sp.]|nr:chloride channel protein [Allosphingosinicella sp.]